MTRTLSSPELKVKKNSRKVGPKIEEKKVPEVSPSSAQETTPPFHKKPNMLIRTFWFLFFITILGAGFYFFGRTSEQKERTVLSSHPLVSSLHVTGKVIPQDSADLSFERAGTVTAILVKEGDKVIPGSTLLTLFAADSSSQIAASEAALAKAKADFRNISRGASKEEIAAKEELVTSSADTLALTYQNVLEIIKTANTTVNKEIRGNLSSLFTYETGDVYKSSFASCDQVTQGVIEEKRRLLQKKLTELDSSASSLSNLSRPSDIEIALARAFDTVAASKAFTSDVQTFLTSDCNGKDMSLSDERASVAASFSALSLLLNDVQLKKNTLSSQKNALEQAKKDLLVITAGANMDERDSLAALVRQAEANLARVKSDEGKTVIKSPFEAIVSKVYAKRGENVQIGAPAISLLSTSGYEVEGYVREIDVTSLHPGSEVSISLDAFPKGTSFQGVISRIDPSPTMQGGVPLYRIIVTFVTQDERIRDGMSAELSMILYKNEQALTISPRFIRMTSDGKAYVRLVNGENVLEKEVATGHRGDSGEIEVVSGVIKGDIVEIMETAARGVQKGTGSNVRQNRP